MGSIRNFIIWTYYYWKRIMNELNLFEIIYNLLIIKKSKMFLPIIINREQIYTLISVNWISWDSNKTINIEPA